MYVVPLRLLQTIYDLNKVFQTFICAPLHRGKTIKSQRRREIAIRSIIIIIICDRTHTHTLWPNEYSKLQTVSHVVIHIQDNKYISSTNKMIIDRKKNYTKINRTNHRNEHQLSNFDVRVQLMSSRFLFMLARVLRTKKYIIAIVHLFNIYA